MNSHSTWSRRGFLRGSLLAGGVLATPALIGACSKTEPGTGASTEGGTLQKAKDAGEITVGFANERPYGFRQDGKLVGESPAVQGYIFDKIGGIELKPKLFEFGSLIPALNSNRVDVVTAGMFITPDRCEQASFSNPVYQAPSAFLVKKGNPEGVTDYKSLPKGAKLAVMNGAVEVGYAKANGVSQDQLQTVADQQSGLDAVKSGRAIAFNLTSISLRWLAKDDSSVEVAEPFVPVVDGEEQLGAGAAVFRDADADLRKAFNDELATLLDDTEQWVELVKPWGFTEAEMPDPSRTAEKLCKG